MALALSEQLAGLATTSASLESILLDEGFGTLDAATLDAVAATLENLAARGDRMVGVVTHVAGLAERVPVRFEVSQGHPLGTDQAGGLVDAVLGGLRGTRRTPRPPTATVDCRESTAHT